MTRHLFTRIGVVLCALMFATCSGSPTSPGIKPTLGASSDTSSYLLPVNRVTDATYSMTLSIGSCAVIPEGQRSRSKTATTTRTAVTSSIEARSRPFSL